VDTGSVYHEEYRHTSLISTLRKTWGLGEAFTDRDASARTFDHVFSLATPRDPQTWATIEARPVPQWMMDPEVVGKALSTLGKGMGPALIGKAKEMGVQLPAEVNDPNNLSLRQVVAVLRQIGLHFFPLLSSDPSSRR
jgi:phospholipase C